MEETTFNLVLCAVVTSVIILLIIMLFNKKDSYGFTGTGRGYGSLGQSHYERNRHHNPQDAIDVRRSRMTQIKNLANDPFYGHDELEGVTHSVNIDSNKYERDGMEDDSSEDSVTQSDYRQRKVRR